jgi:glutamine synthetase
VTAGLLAGIPYGISQGLEPPPPVRGNAYREGGTPLPSHWATAIERFRASEFAASYLGRPFRDLYATVKQAELDDFNSYVTPLEIEWYMGAI